MTLIGTTVPQLPVLSSAFVTDGITTALTKEVSSGHLIAHTIGQLQCSDKREAEKFNCQFPSNVCTCSAAVNRATCTCSSGNVRKTLKKTPLPVVMKNVMIYQNGKSVEAKMNVGTALQLHLVAEGLKLTSLMENATCTAVASDVIGCYHCLNGARLELACHSSANEITAEISCGSQQQVAVCTRTGHVNTITFNFETPTVKENCTLRCPGGLTNFVISGNLEYINDGLHVEETNNYESDSNFGSISISNVISLLKTSFSMATNFLSSLIGLNFIFTLLALFLIVTIFNSLRNRSEIKKSM
ncbi:hypothetical protein COOONC_27008 [Cooperia oncophora]